MIGCDYVRKLLQIYMSDQNMYGNGIQARCCLYIRHCSDKHTWNLYTSTSSVLFQLSFQYEIEWGYLADLLHIHVEMYMLGLAVSVSSCLLPDNQPDSKSCCPRRLLLLSLHAGRRGGASHTGQPHTAMRCDN